jgi:CRP-like cAMP-binding protein
VTADGHELTLALRGNGDLVGELAGETTGQRNATVRAISTVRALIVPYDTFSSFLDAHPGAGKAYRHVVTHRWNDADTMLRSHPVTNGAHRLAIVLLDLATRYGSEAAAQEVHIAVPLSQDELASLAGASRATVTRALSNWRRRGIIRTGQRDITITALDDLRRIAGHQS